MMCPGCGKQMIPCEAPAFRSWQEWVRIGFVHADTKRPLCVAEEERRRVLRSMNEPGRNAR